MDNVFDLSPEVDVSCKCDPRNMGLGIANLLLWFCAG